MTINSLYKYGNCLVQNAQKFFGKNNSKIPRYLSHITTKANYNSMLASGVIKTSKDVSPLSTLDGVFMFDMKNFTKRWFNTWVRYDNSGEKYNIGSVLLGKHSLISLMQQGADKSSELVLLRFRTNKFDINKLRVRIQNITKASYKPNGESALFQRMHTRRKDAIEYIYSNNLNIADAEKIGELRLNFKSVNEVLKYVSEKHFDTLLKLVKGQPEANCVKAMENVNIKPKFIIDT